MKAKGAPALRTYRGAWLLLLGGTALGVAWVVSGEAYVRRRFLAAPKTEAPARGETQFLALLFPRVTEKPSRFAMSPGNLDKIARELKERGYAPIGLRDVLELYARGRPLPAKAVLLAFDKDYPESAALAEKVFRRRRLRGVLFLSRVAGPGGGRERRFLSRHAVGQLIKGRAWDLGWKAGGPRPDLPQGVFPDAVLAEEGTSLAEGEGDSRPGGPLRFVRSQFGHNDERDSPAALRILELRPEAAPRELLAVIEGAWPRREEFVDTFASGRLNEDWIEGWGVVSARSSGLTLLPTPRQTGAAVILRGTEKWSDLSLEFDLKRHHNEFWAYARYADDGRFIRVGAKDGIWYVEQKISAGLPPGILGRTGKPDDGRASRVRLVLKGDWAILHINGRMQFGKALRLHPNVDRGRVELGVYDPQRKSARGLLTYVRAAPGGRQWVAVRDEAGLELDERRLESLREAAVTAWALSPSWIKVGPDGAVAASARKPELIESMAGFYRCRLVPLADFPAQAGPLLADAAASARLSAQLAQAQEHWESAGLNLHLRRWDPQRGEAAPFLARLRDELHARRRKLWITVDGDGPVAAEISRAVDGVLRQGKRLRGLTVLVAGEKGGAR